MLLRLVLLSLPVGAPVTRRPVSCPPPAIGAPPARLPAGSRDATGSLLLPSLASMTALTWRADAGGAADLGRTLRRIAARATGLAGVTVLHVESGERVSVRGGERFPMASVYKLPIAIALLARVDDGTVDLSTPVPVTLADLRPGFSPLAAELGGRLAAGEAVSLPLDTLLARMLGGSDNSASDLVLRAAGGASAVTARLRALQLADVRVDRPESRLVLDYFGVTDAPPPTAWRLADIEHRLESVLLSRRRVAARRFLHDERDTATPDGMATLLAQLQRGELLSPAATARLLRLMTGTTTGPGRLRGALPAGTVVAHKTGTTGTTIGRTAAVNDVGIVTLPDGTHLVIAAFVRDVTGEVPGAEGTIAQLARAAFDHWAAE